MIKKNSKIDERDVEIIEKRAVVLLKPKALQGDFILLLDGRYRRVAHVHDDGMQPTLSSKTDCSFYLSDFGGSYSGGLGSLIPFSRLRLTNRLKDGMFWIFHHNLRQANNGVNFLVPCKVWKEIAE